MGTVVQAWDARLLRDVAIKVPPPHLASHPQFRQRFLREAQALARLNHPNVASVFDIPDVREGEIPVMILEFIEGIDLSEVLTRKGVPSFKQAATWLLQAAAGIQHAHEREILHRDIKPANLMITPQGILKILDFGLAAIGDQEGLTATGMLMGSIPFMPPEQLRGERVSELADQYALGATAFQVFTGDFPFAPDDAERLRAPSILEQVPSFPAEVDQVIQRALQPRPEERFSSVLEFRQNLHKTADQALRIFASRQAPVAS
jgi:serine/threonine-protein kinase